MKNQKSQSAQWSRDIDIEMNAILPPVLKSTILEPLAAQSHSAIGLFDCQYFTYIFRTTNLPFLLNDGISKTIFLLSKQFMGHIAAEKRLLIKMSVCGTIPSAFHTKGKNILFQCTPLSFDEEYYPKIYLEYIRNITHLMTEDGFWLRIVYGGEVLCWSSGQEKILRHDIISDREKEVVRLLAKGRQLSCIAEELNISINTVKNHLKACCTRLFARNNTCLVQLCMLSGILATPVL